MWVNKLVLLASPLPTSFTTRSDQLRPLEFLQTSLTLPASISLLRLPVSARNAIPTPTPSSRGDLTHPLRPSSNTTTSMKPSQGSCDEQNCPTPTPSAVSPCCISCLIISVLRVLSANACRTLCRPGQARAVPPGRDPPSRAGRWSAPGTQGRNSLSPACIWHIDRAVMNPGKQPASAPFAESVNEWVSEWLG